MGALPGAPAPCPGRLARRVRPDTGRRAGRGRRVLGQAHRVGHRAGRPGDARGRGAGRALLDAAIAWGRSRGLDRLELWVTRGNGPAVRLYERAGFADTGRRDVLPSNPALQTIQIALNLR